MLEMIILVVFVQTLIMSCMHLLSFYLSVFLGRFSYHSFLKKGKFVVQLNAKVPFSQRVS